MVAQRTMNEQGREQVHDNLEVDIWVSELAEKRHEIITHPFCRIHGPFAKQSWILSDLKSHKNPEQLVASLTVVERKGGQDSDHRNAVLRSPQLRYQILLLYLVAASEISSEQLHFLKVIVCVPKEFGLPNLCDAIAKTPTSQATDFRSETQLVKRSSSVYFEELALH